MTVITNDRPWLHLVAPYGLRKGGYLQVYAGAQNENVYTNGFQGPLWGYKKVIQTFELTDSPRRFKPIDIYYHFYSGSKTAALKALQTVFDWALRQEVIPLFTTEYIQKVMEYYDVSLSREEGGWRIAGMRHLRTLRLSDRMTAVDLEKSRELLGMRRVETRRYLALTGEGDPRIAWIRTPRKNPEPICFRPMRH